MDEFLLMLDGVKRMGDKYIARCPAHDDGRPSLQVSQGEKGILVRCYAGCSYNEIVSALGLNPGDLFKDALTEENKARYRWKWLHRRIQNLETTIIFFNTIWRMD